jgi:hypothetical protein
VAQRVRTHTRRNKDGSTTRVTQHTRAGRPRKALVSPGHSWKLLKQAMAHGRKKRRGMMALFGTLAALELGAWLTLEGVGFALVTTGALAVAVGAVAAAAGGVRP